MKKVFLKQLRLTNFKGIRDLSIEFNERTNIQGRNRAGKSTVFDSFCWLLWGKDQFDRKDYEIKTLDEKNQPIHKLSHEVEGVFMVNGVEERPKRIYRETWTRKRGKEKDEFTGHETVYYWNDVPMKMSDYQVKIGEIISEGMFKLITNTLYFNSLPWEKRRSCLLDIAGTISDAEIFAKIKTHENDYSNLIKILDANKTAADHKKEIGAKKLKIKKELEDIPARVDEAERSKPESFDFDNILTRINDYVAAIDNIDNVLSDAAKAQAEMQKGLMQKQSKVHNLKTELSKIRYGIRTEIETEQNNGASKISLAESDIRNHEQTIATIKNQIKYKEDERAGHNSTIDLYKKKLEKLGDEYDAIDDEEFNFDDTACTCPTCKQMLQQHDIDRKKQELLGNFNDNKQERLQRIVDEANRTKKHIATLEKAIETVDEQINDRLNEIGKLQAKIPELKTKLDTLRLVERNKAAFDLEKAVNERMNDNAAAVDLYLQIEALEGEIKAETTVTHSDANNEPLKAEKQILQQQLNALRNQYANKETLDRINKRIGELQRQEEVLSQELAGHEKTEFDILNYEKAKMDILESRINSKFKLVSFKMFNRQINGGEEPCCECLYKGVPYGSLNTEAKINCGLDIINVLCDHYQVYAPVFIDNRESVTEIISTNSQVISLIVNPAFDKLEVEAA